LSTGDKKNCWFTAQRSGGWAAARQNRRSRVGETRVALKVAFLLAVGQDLALQIAVIWRRSFQRGTVLDWNTWFWLWAVKGAR